LSLFFVACSIYVHDLPDYGLPNLALISTATHAS
jgi:hypothetical protein